MKGWAWVLIGGGAFTMLAGYLASRAKAQPGADRLPAQIVVPSGVHLTDADVGFINTALVAKQNEEGPNFDMNRWATSVNGILSAYATQHPAGMSFSQFAAGQ